MRRSEFISLLFFPSYIVVVASFCVLLLCVRFQSMRTDLMVADADEGKMDRKENAEQEKRIVWVTVLGQL